MDMTISRRLGAAVAAGAVTVGLALGAAPAASAEEGVDLVGPNATSLGLNGYPGLVGNSGPPGGVRAAGSAAEPRRGLRA